MDQYYPGGDKTDSLTVMSYTAAQTLLQVLKQCGDDLTHENVLQKAANLHELRHAAAGHHDQYRPTDYAPLKQMQMMRFTGEHWSCSAPS
jgi:branched-chain amino acid transport system substrate-binding protein